MKNTENELYLAKVCERCGAEAEYYNGHFYCECCKDDMEGKND